MNAKQAGEPSHYEVSQLKSLVEKCFSSNDVGMYTENFLFKTIRRRLLETQCDTPLDYVKLIGQNPEESGLFLSSLQNSYSEFFRNPLTFAVLELIVLPSLLQKQKSGHRKEIRIWSAACAAGQESYSLAMLFEELKNSGNNTFNYRIFATDHNETQLTIASKGQYSSDAINNLTRKRIRQWFDHQGETYTVKPELKENIDFSVFDLFDGNLSCPPASIFGDFDLVICANLLFYYKDGFRDIILDKIGSCLSHEGYLITGETERSILLNRNLTEVFPQSAIFRMT